MIILGMCIYLFICLFTKVITLLFFWPDDHVEDIVDDVDDVIGDVHVDDL